MDGIELVKETENLKKCPKIVVVSGYDDFNYAVEMLKHGVKDYILKPVKREKIEELLKKLDAEINGERRLEGIELQAFARELKLYLKQPSVLEKELESVRWKFEQYMGQEPYYAVVSARRREEEEKSRSRAVWNWRWTDRKSAFYRQHIRKRFYRMPDWQVLWA